MTNGHKLIIVPRYFDVRTVKADDRKRICLPSNVRTTISSRNAYNLMSRHFTITEYQGRPFLSYDDNRFAEIFTEGFSQDINSMGRKEDIDTSSIDDIVYLGRGLIEEGKPRFTPDNPNVIFLYSAMDAMRMLYDEEWRDMGFNLNHRASNVDDNGRILLNDLEHSIAIENKKTVLTGHPKLFCVTLTKEMYQTIE